MFQVLDAANARLLQSRSAPRGAGAAGQTARPQDACRNPRRPHCRNRSVSRAGRCGCTLRGREDAAQRCSLRPSRPRLCLLHLRQSLLPECLLPSDGVPGGVLFRALEPVAGLELMAKARGIEIEIGSKIKGLATRKKISSGPAACLKPWESHASAKRKDPDQRALRSPHRR